MAAAFGLKLEPADRVLFASKKLGQEPVQVTLRVSNPFAERVIFKVKCTSNDLFRIRPPVGAIKGGEKAEIQFSFNAGKPVPESDRHYFAFHYRKSTDESILVKNAWEGKDADAMKRLMIDFKKDDEAAAAKTENDKKKDLEKSADELKEKSDQKESEDA